MRDMRDMRRSAQARHAHVVLDAMCRAVGKAEGKSIPLARPALGCTPPCSQRSIAQGMFVHVVYDAMTQGQDSQASQWGMLGALVCGDTATRWSSAG